MQNFLQIIKKFGLFSLGVISTLLIIIMFVETIHLIISCYRKQISNSYVWFHKKIFIHIKRFVSQALWRILFLLSTDPVEKIIKAKVNIDYKSIIADVERQFQLITADRDHWRRGYYDQQKMVEKRYWEGFKEGHKASEQNKSINEVKNPKRTVQY